MVRDFEKYIDESEFLVTYGDCLSNIDVYALIESYKKNSKIATVALAKPTGRNQLLPIDDEGELRYENVERVLDDTAWVNADCFIFHRKVFDYLTGNYDLEKQLFPRLSELRQVGIYKHRGFWMPIETRRDLIYINGLWNAGTAPWKRE